MRCITSCCNVWQVSADTGGGGHSSDVIAQRRHQQVPARAAGLRASALLGLRARRAVVPPPRRPPPAFATRLSRPRPRRRRLPHGGAGRGDVTHRTT